MTRRLRMTDGTYTALDAFDYERARKYVWYCEASGRTHYAVGKLTVRIAGRAYGRRFTGYRRKVKLHRWLLGFPSQQVDHANGNGLDNRRCNLRLATRSQQARNAKKKSGCASIYKGVTQSRDSGHRPWRAYIYVDKRPVNLGSFPNERDAAIAYNGAATAVYGKFARLNII